MMKIFLYLKKIYRTFRSFGEKKEMTTHREKIAKLPPAERELVEAKTQELHREYLALKKLREFLNLKQEEVAERLGMQQPFISKLENGGIRLTLGTLSQLVTLLGGKLKVEAEFSGIGKIDLMDNDESENRI